MNEVQNQTELNFVGQELTEQESAVFELSANQMAIEQMEKTIKELQARKKELEAKNEELKETLRPFIGQTIKGFKITTKAGDSLIMAEGAIIPEQYKRVKVEPDKLGLKKAIQAGENFDGFWIETKHHLNLSCLI
jgi:malate synthase